MSDREDNLLLIASNATWIGFLFMLFHFFFPYWMVGELQVSLQKENLITHHQQNGTVQQSGTVQMIKSVDVHVSSAHTFSIVWRQSKTDMKDL